jgi:PD-(D/E)XK nuclease superfamily protein
VLDPIITSHPLTGAQRRVSIDLLREVYLVPDIPAADIGLLVSDERNPWSESYTNAPRETLSAVSGALRSLMVATRRIDPSEIDISKLDPGSRLFHHVEALLRVWVAMGDAIPRDLQVIRHVICSDGSDALEPLPIIDTSEGQFSSRADTELLAALVRHHGRADPDAQRLWEKRENSIFQGARSSSSLGTAQQGLLDPDIRPVPADGSLSFWGVRDLAEETELAAAMSQKLIGEGAAAEDIAILLPDDPGYLQHVASAFQAVGVPLSGLPISAPRRDIATETLLHFVLALNSPAPAMVLASLYVSPLMPWSADTGAALAREVMKGHFKPSFAQSFEGKAKRLFEAIHDDAKRDPSKISDQLDLLSQSLSDGDDCLDDVRNLHAQLPGLQGLLATMEQTNWERLLEELHPAAPVSSSPERFVEGVSVFYEGSLPWRSAKHLLILGAVGGRFPRGSSASPIFLDSETETLESCSGIKFPGRADHLEMGLELFRRQFSVPSDSCTFVFPMRNSDGNRLSTSTVLDLIARTVLDEKDPEGKPVEEPEDLIKDIRLTPRTEWPCSARTIPTIERTLTEQIPEDGQINLGRDLFRSRLDSDGAPKRQSPSRLEKLMISPLAWVLGEFGAEERVWKPESYDHILSGTLAHEVMEHLFPKNRPLPDESTINKDVGGLLSQAVRKHAPFLNGTLWQVERQGLEREIISAAKKWSTALSGIGATVIDNEIELTGEAHGLNLFGRADCLLSLPDGRILIIDHKKSSSRVRRERMQVGWDLQLGLYRAMLNNPSLEDSVLNDMLTSKPDIGVAYHLINDSGILVNGILAAGEDFEVIDNDISEQAVKKLQERIAEVRQGLVSLNFAGDITFFEKIAKTTPYALKESALVAAFFVPKTTRRVQSNA